jgi:hypothetical protein
VQIVGTARMTLPAPTVVHAYEDCDGDRGTAMHGAVQRRRERARVSVPWGT